MAFVLVKAQKKSERDTEPFVIWFDPKNPNRAPGRDVPKDELDSFTYNLCTFTGGDSLRFSDMMMVTEGEQQKLKAGTVAREKCIRATVSIEGMVDEDGKPITALTHEIYAATPTWMLNKLLAEVNERNAEDEEAEGN